MADMQSFGSGAVATTFLQGGYATPTLPDVSETLWSI